jgi:hypothetical protein
MTQTSAATDTAVNTTLDDNLKKLAVTIRAEHKRGVEGIFRIGHALLAARAILPGDAEYGKWLDAQDFDFCARTANNYRFAAEHESVIRSLMRTEKTSGRPMPFTTAVELVRNPPKKGSDKWGRAPSTHKRMPSRHWARLVAAADIREAALDRDDEVGYFEWVKMGQAVNAEIAKRVPAGASQDTVLAS